MSKKARARAPKADAEQPAASDVQYVLATTIVQNDVEGARHLSRGIELALPLSVVKQYEVKRYQPNIDSMTLDHLTNALERSIYEQKARRRDK